MVNQYINLIIVIKAKKNKNEKNVHRNISKPMPD
jgi:hypothetical protein